jgi:integrase/recombinase XerC
MSFLLFQNCSPLLLCSQGNLNSGLQNNIPAIDSSKHSEIASESWNDQPLSAQTRRAYNSRLNNFLGFLGTHLDSYPNALLDAEIRDELVHDYTKYLENLRYGARTINGYLTMLDSFFGFVGLGSCAADRHPEPPPQPVALSNSEKQVLLTAIPRYRKIKDRAILSLLFRCGLRISEVAALDIGSIKRNHVLVVRHRAARSIELDQDSKVYLAAWIKQRKSRYGTSHGPALFISGRGQRITTTGIDCCIKQFAQQTTLANLSANTLRHSFIVDQLKAVRDAKRVSKIPGHVKLETTLRHLDPYLRVHTPLDTPV